MALLVIKAGFNPVPAIVAAQAVTVVAAPLLAGVLLWLTNRRDVMGEETNGPLTNVAAGIGLVLLVAMAGYTAVVKIPQGVERWQKSREKAAATAKADLQTWATAMKAPPDSPKMPSPQPLATDPRPTTTGTASATNDPPVILQLAPG